VHDGILKKRLCLVVTALAHEQAAEQRAREGRSPRRSGFLGPLQTTFEQSLRLSQVALHLQDQAGSDEGVRLIGRRERFAQTGRDR